MPEFELVIDEVESRVREQRLEHGVHSMRERLHLLDLRARRPSEHADVIVVDQGIVQRVALQEEFENRLRQPRALLDAIALGHRAGADVAHDALDRNHLHRAHQRFALVQYADEMRWNAGGGELAHDVGIELVVGLALAFQLGELRPVERRHVVSIMHDEHVGIVGGIHGLGLAAIQFLPLFHGISVK